jgi:hypothetical protein
MRTESEFKTFYRTTLLPLLQEIDKLRRQMCLKNFLITIVYFGCIASLFALSLVVNRMIYGVWFTDSKANVPVIIAVIATIVSFLFYIGKIHANKREFVSRYKKEIIGSIVRFIDESLLYEAGNLIAQHEFIASKLFYPTPDRYSGDDYVSGRIGKTEIAFSEIHAQYKTVISGDNGEKKEKWTSLFDGIFFKADFNKDFKGEYFVLPDMAEKLFGRAGTVFQSAIKRFGELIRLEDTEFERQFVVYGSDQVEARYILSASLMKRMLDFKQRTGKKINISFVRSYLYIAIPFRKALFEPRYYSSVISEEKTTEYFLDLEMAIGIVTDLNLNTRIWSKQ